MLQPQTIAGPASLALTSLTPDQITFIESLPKAELHAHLNGSIPLHILQDLAIEYIESHQAEPENNNDNSDDGRAAALSNQVIQAGIQKLTKGVQLDEIHDFFGLFPAIYALTSTPEALARATRGVLEAFLLPSPSSSQPQCSYLELRTTPRSTPFMSREAYLRTVLSEIEAFTSSSSSTMPGRAGSGSGVGMVGLIVSLDRRMSQSDMREVVDIAIKLKNEGLGIVGVDLCGDPTAGDVDEFREFFEDAKRGGLGVTLHIAETLRNSPAETKKLLSFNPDRLGHATFLDEEAKRLVLEKKTCIEMCLTSNLLCKTVPDLDSHHIRYYLQHQHPIAICTDDILPFRTSLTAEYAFLLAKAPLGLGLTENEVCTIAEMSMNSRFLA